MKPITCIAVHNAWPRSCRLDDENRIGVMRETIMLYTVVVIVIVLAILGFVFGRAV
ncbi:MAG: hypothetical protein PVSMB7_26990 [Chloroflexota bacterium]